MVTTFQFAANDVDPGGDEVAILALAGGGHDRVVLTLRRAGAAYHLSLYGRENGGALRRVGRVKVPRRRTTRLAIEWAQASSTASSDGVLRLLKKGRARIVAADLDNGGQVIDELEIGLPNGVISPGAGHFLLDEFLLTP